MIAALACAMIAPQATLTQEQVNKKLNIPIFLPMNNLGRPMMAAHEGRPVVLVFFRKADSDAAIKGSAAETGAKIGRTAVGTLSDLQTMKGALPFYVPVASEQDKALSVGNLKTLITTAVFYVSSKGGTQVTLQADGKTLAPFCFAWEDAEQIRKDALESKKVVEPVVKMTTLNQLIEMIKTKPAAEADRIVLVEHKAAREDVKLMTGGG